MAKRALKSKKQNKKASKKSVVLSTSNNFLTDIVIFSLIYLTKIGYYAELPFKNLALNAFAASKRTSFKKIKSLKSVKKRIKKKTKVKTKKIQVFKKALVTNLKRTKKTTYNLFKKAFKTSKNLTLRTFSAILSSINAFESNSNSFISILEKNTPSLKNLKKWSISKTKKHSKKKKAKVKNRVFLSKPRLIVLGILLTGIFIFSGIKVHDYLSKIPDPKNIDEFPIPAATLIYDRNGTLLYSAYADSFRIPVPLSKIPKVMQDATIAAEDQRFFKHRGFDLIAIVRSVINNIQGKSLQGGSTITQQVAKNTFLSNKKTISRKIEEVVISERLERRLTKKEILELYFNTVSYGGNTIGIKTAALHYFGKDLKNLTLKEIVFLASITPAPSVFSQEVGDKLVHPERMEYVLDRMETEKMIDKAQRNKIEKEKLVFTPQLAYKKAPHAVDFILSELEKKYGRDQVLKHGLIVKTTIDLPFQNFVQKTVLENVTASLRNNLTNTGVVVVNPASGGVLAMVGSPNYYDQEGGQFNTVTAERQLGSTMKVITYARAFEDGLTPYSTIVDSPTKFSGYSDYKPRNYDGKFHGRITLRSAFANSYNIPALKLAAGAGIDRVAALGYKMGIKEFNFGDKPKPLSMAIGGVEVSLINLVQAYSVVANGGNKVDINPITEISDHNGKLIYRKEVQGEQVISKTTADEIFSVLSDNAARLPAFGRSYQLEFANAQVAVKTGTSNDVKDNVAIAFDKDFVVGVWAGNNNSSPMWGVVSGYSAPTLTMHEVVEKILADYAPVNLSLSANLKNQGEN